MTITTNEKIGMRVPLMTLLDIVLRRWVGTLIGMGHRSVLTVEFAKSQLNTFFFLRIHHIISEDKILQLFEVSAISSIYTAGDLIKKFLA